MALSFPQEWVDKTAKLNENREIKRGDVVVDRYRNKGVVVKVDIPENPSVEDHGLITVWQSERMGHGDDNCEHYVWINWKSNLRILAE